MNISEIAKHRVLQFEERFVPRPLVRTQNFKLPVDLVARLNALSAFLCITKTSILEDLVYSGLSYFEKAINENHMQVDGMTVEQYAESEEARLIADLVQSSELQPESLKVVK